MARLSIPISARLPSSLRIDPSNPGVVKSVSRLSRDSLISLALYWLDGGALGTSAPYLETRDESDAADDIWPACRSVDELQQLYLDLQTQRGSKRDVVSRILEGDWRHGLTLYQLATVDFSYLEEHPNSQKWSAYKILPLRAPEKDADDEVLTVDTKSLSIPRFHPSTFLQNLQDQVLPDVKAHYHFYRPQDMPVLMLRIFVLDSPYNTSLALSSSADGGGSAANFSSSRTIYLAFPDGSPSLYITKSQSTGPTAIGESKSLHGLVVGGVPKALSRPRERYTLKSASLSSRNLDAILDKRGAGRGNAAGGGWSIYADDKNKKSPLDPVLPTPPLSRDSSSSSRSEQKRKRDAPATKEQSAAKRARLLAEARFGSSGIVTDGKGVERVDFLMQDAFPAPDTFDDEDSDDNEAGGRRAPGAGRRSAVDSELQSAREDADEDGDAGDGPGASQWKPLIRVTLRGPHVFAGVRQLVEAGIVDGERMPGWMTGEEGVTTGVIRNGRIQGNKGSGL